MHGADRLQARIVYLMLHASIDGSQCGDGSLSLSLFTVHNSGAVRQLCISVNDDQAVYVHF